MKRIAFSIASFLLLTLLLASPGCKSSSANAPAAKAPAWERLGERLVDFKGDRDIIQVTAKEGKFSAVKFRVNRAPIFLNAVTITYGNGETHRVAVNKRIPAGSETRAFSLPGGNRFIRNVGFTYRTAPRATTKALLVLYGRH